MRVTSTIATRCYIWITRSRSAGFPATRWRIPVIRSAASIWDLRPPEATTRSHAGIGGLGPQRRLRGLVHAWRRVRPLGSSHMLRRGRNVRINSWQRRWLLSLSTTNAAWKTKISDSRRRGRRLHWCWSLAHRLALRAWHWSLTGHHGWWLHTWRASLMRRWISHVVLSVRSWPWIQGLDSWLLIFGVFRVCCS